MTRKIITQGFKAAAIGTALSLTFIAGQAQATEGYFSHGFGVRNSALAGAGVADSADAMAVAINPAGLVDVGREFNGGVTFFAPFREYTATGTGFVAPGNHDSSSNFFAIPNLGYNHPISPDSAVGISLYGNGGMNTTFRGITNLGPSCTGAPGVFCAGDTGVDLTQAFLSVGYAHRFGKVSFGVAPVMAIQLFKAKGLAAFSGASSSPTNLTNNGYDTSVGFGARVGAQIDVTDGFRIGASYQSKMYMNDFDNYRGLFEGGGNFDIPASVTAGIALDVTPSVTVMLDYKRIFYSGVDAISNSSAITGPAVLGTSGGPGFGWEDINSYKFGVEWKQNEQWTWRAGYSYNDNPVQSADVTFNILAPGIVQHHITGGGSYAIDEKNNIDFSIMFAPNSSLSGPELTARGLTPGSNIELEMSQLAVSVGWTHKW